MKDNLIIVGLDIGTTKITTVIGEIGANGAVDIIGEGTVPSEGMKRGAVVNLERTTHAIRQSVLSAERVAGVKVTEAHVGVSGSHIKALTSHGLAAIRRQQEISRADVERAIENARAVPLDPNYEVIHALPQEYVIDGQEGIKNPVGMHGVRLEVDVHIVSGASGPLANLRRCVNEAGLQVRGFVLQALASGLSTLDPHEQDATVVLIDIGGSTTDVGVFKRGNLAHSASIPLGSDHVTTDLAQILKIPFEEAERVKRKYGAALPEMAETDLSLEITSGNGSVHAISAYELSRVIKPRLAEIFNFVRDEIDSALGPVELVAGSVVLTGGGSLLRGTAELARDRFRLPVRLARARGIGGLTDIVSSPTHATAVGLALYGLSEGSAHPVQRVMEVTPEVLPAYVDEPRLSEAASVGAGKPAEGASRKPPTEGGKSWFDRVKELFRDWL
ncbi:cell division protein FtsA [Deinococcus peraridilitoris]|uniref:Cell division protein FtsA n=1 Tax=Deinococcus peraridilitoris (strain DSM 19664 / LMG 22246 / CIP 109416 / KR-200) TaxID=937777 RepID=K9ZX81_DEIPD|nr:cell division protein FtsA [Deinococcus peraridilitoris]AFZ65804.1 cell division protein FtsA [Deinococcus peraridilitoris DSM 19664]